MIWDGANGNPFKLCPMSLEMNIYPVSLGMNILRLFFTCVTFQKIYTICVSSRSV